MVEFHKTRLPEVERRATIIRATINLGKVTLCFGQLAFLHPRLTFEHFLVTRQQNNEHSKRKRPRPDLSRIQSQKNQSPKSENVGHPRESEVSNSDEASVAKRVILSRRIDPLMGGGISLLIALFVISFGWITQSGVSQFLLAIELYLFTDLFINGPHFMASYRLLYSRTGNLRKHPIVTLAFPAISALFLIYIIYSSYQQSFYDPLGIMGVLTLIAPIVLAWHYTGQSWGTTACFAHLEGFRISPIQRRLVRGGFLALFLYHIAWAYDSTGFIQQTLSEQDAGKYLMQSVMSLCRLLVAIGFVAGLYGFWTMSQQSNRQIPIRIWLPWAATFSWYAMVDINPASFFLLQIFHALQYLMFPIRVEINDYTPQNKRKYHLLIYYVCLVAVGYLAFEWASFPAVPKQLIPAGAATMMIINLHHYFIDAVIWKIREPEVRNSLFGHLETTT